MRVLYSVICCLLISLHVSAQSYQIYHTASGKSISFEEMAKQLSTADIIIFGEEHNDSIAHVLQLELYEKLDYFHKGEIVLSLEMFERDVQSIMDEYLAGWISEKNFIKESRAWGNYKDYRPLIEYAKRYGLPVICANSPARYTNMVTRGGLSKLNVLPKQTRQKYLAPLPIDTLKGKYYDKFLEAMGGHLMPGMHLYQAQNVWDATMANSIQEAVKQYHAPVLHLNGRFHSDYYLGVAKRLQMYYGPTKKILTISAFKGNAYNEDLHSTLADFVIITNS